MLLQKLSVVQSKTLLAFFGCFWHPASVVKSWGSGVLECMVPSERMRDGDPEPRSHWPSEAVFSNHSNLSEAGMIGLGLFWVGPGRRVRAMGVAGLMLVGTATAAKAWLGVTHQPKGE